MVGIPWAVHTHAQHYTCTTLVSPFLKCTYLFLFCFVLFFKLSSVIEVSQTQRSSILYVVDDVIFLGIGQLLNSNSQHSEPVPCYSRVGQVINSIYYRYCYLDLKVWQRVHDIALL